MEQKSEAFERVEGYYMAFRDGIARCQNAPCFIAADWQDAYARLARLRERYCFEAPSLSKSERNALSKVFEHDTFIEGMMNLRQIAEHVQKRTDLVIRTTNNVPIALASGSSALAVFGAAIAKLSDTSGKLHDFDHLRSLREAERRIASAMVKAHA